MPNRRVFKNRRQYFAKELLIEKNSENAFLPINSAK
jgi:hypothetical protein